MSSDCDASSGDGRIAEAIALMSAELERLADVADEVEDAVSVLTRAAGPQSASVSASIQKLDLLGQTVKALAVFTDAIAGDLEAGAAPDIDAAADGLPLRDLARRLRRRGEGAIEASAGEMTLF